jgi:outer membrane lipoprotein-sorting protein
MRINLLLILLGLTIGPLAGQSDPAAEKLLKDVSEKFERYNNVSVDFVYELYNPEANVKQETNGKVIFSGNKYRAEYMGVIDIFDGKRRYVIVPENQEVNVMTVKDDEEVTPARMFDFYKKGYRFKMDIKQPVGGRTIRYIKLFPLKDNEIDYVLIGVDVKTKHIYKIIIIQKNKTRITVNIRKFTVNKPVSEQLFKFDQSKYPDYFINELD